MKALILAGGLPQIDLIEKLKQRNIKIVLADYYKHPVAREYADIFYQISTLDIASIKTVAQREKVDFLITVCTDQALVTVAQVSEELDLPCYISCQAARNVTNKSYMKDIFRTHGIPTAKYAVMEDLDEGTFIDWKYPLIVKPVDCNSSKGVRKVQNIVELKRAFSAAISISRTNTAIVEEFIDGLELSVDVYVENGQAIVLDITESEKIKDNEKFIICRTWHPPRISKDIRHQVEDVIQQIADAFQIKESPMLVQMMSSGEEISVLEFSARTGGGVKHLSIQRQTGVDVISAVIDLTLGKKPHISMKEPEWKYMLDEYIYCSPGIYDHLEGFEELKLKGTLIDYYLFKWRGAKFDTIENSGDRIGGFTITAGSLEELARKHRETNFSVKVVSAQGTDMMRHDLLKDFGRNIAEQHNQVEKAELEPYESWEGCHAY